jgi:hypothetical protein
MPVPAKRRHLAAVAHPTLSVRALTTSLSYDGRFMKLPNGERAVLDIRKLQLYCLNALHPRGRNKARVFASAGIRWEDAEELRTALVAAAGSGDARPGIASVHGQRYVVDFDLVRQGGNIKIRSTWIVRIG